jgi:hypothetical protein
MYVRPGYTPDRQSSTPPEDKSQRLATFPRGEGVEMRVTLAEFNESVR